MADFKRQVTQDQAPRLSTLRTQVLVIGAILGREGRHPVLRLGMGERWRQRFAALLQRIAALTISTVAQFTANAKNLTLRPWKPRRPAHRHPLVLVPN
jgi:hypothetical protein